MNEFGMELKSKTEKEMNLELNRIGNEKWIDYVNKNEIEIESNSKLE